MMGLKLNLILLSVISLYLPVQANTADIPEQCTQWVAAAKSSDLNSSGVHLHDKYYTFLTSIEDPLCVKDYENYANLPWECKVIYMYIACNCVVLEEGDDCCVGDVELLLGLDDSTSTQLKQDVVSTDHKGLICEQISHLVNRVPASKENVLPIPAIQYTASAESDTTARDSPEESTLSTLPVDAVREEVLTEQKEETEINRLGAGTAGILFAVFIILYVVYYILSAEKERQKREVAEKTDKDHGMILEIKESEEVVVTEKQEEVEDKMNELDDVDVVTESKRVEEVAKDKDERVSIEPDDESIWSNDIDDKSVIEAESSQDVLKPTISGSDLAAMGVSSRLATNIMLPAPISPAPNKEDENGEGESFEALL